MAARIAHDMPEQAPDAAHDTGNEARARLCAARRRGSRAADGEQGGGRRRGAVGVPAQVEEGGPAVAFAVTVAVTVAGGGSGGVAVSTACAAVDATEGVQPVHCRSDVVP
ncbi:predicted protein [Histoplasma capsulatum var. duboisii H88]|uniref:Predicted protein n=1 Tax=Ajellomyces capsulatus (strain H88) TaxID=544711 RepID=F0U9W3_AJEC8|nr:predicted protein [Histoplasma capsulatum var. duboisii H88]